MFSQCSTDNGKSQVKNVSLIQLQSLGYQSGDQVWIRCLAGKGFNIGESNLYPFDGYLSLASGSLSFTRLNSASKGGGVKFTRKDGLEYLREQNKKGYGIYLIPNKGGRKDDEITSCPSLFYECDGIPKSDQLDRINRLPLAPSLIIETRNSIHVYYRTKEDSPTDWRNYQKRLIQLMDSDPAIHNESRLMRLAGFDHQKAGADPYPIKILETNTNIYSRDQFDQLLPVLGDRWTEIKQKEQQEPIGKYSHAMTIPSFPLEICLSKHSRDLITNGVAKGEGYTEGFKLACDLIGTAEWLTNNGYKFSGLPENLFREFAHKSRESYESEDDIEKVLSHARGTTPTPSLPDDAIENCVAAWTRKQTPKKRPSSNVVTHPNFAHKPIETDKLEEAIDNLTSQNLTGSKLEIKIASIAKEFNLTHQQVTSIYKERLQENDQDLDKDDLYSDLDNIVRAKNQGIDLNRVLPKSIATPILHHAKITGLRPEAYLLSLLTGLGCCHHPDTALELLESSDWKTAPNLYSCIVAPSGTGKSIIARTVIEKPLKALSERDDAEYKAKMKEYKQSLKNPDSDMEKPVRRIRYFSGGTNEGIGRYAALNPDKGLLLNRDEISGLFKSANMYRGGRGSDSEDFLEWYDGTAKINLRADPDKTVICRKILLSIYGTIQPAILEKLLGDQQDSSGQWARFLFCQLPEILTLLDVDAPKIDITPALSHLYESLDQLPPNYYRFNRTALIKFIDTVNEYKKKAFKEQKPALKNVYRKIQESIGKLALNLHIVWNLANQITPSLTIPEDIVDMAIELADFFVNEVKSLQTVMADDLPSHYARILSVATDWISAGKLRAAAFNTKTRQQYPTTRINEICSELTDKGFGEIRYSIRGSIEFRAFSRDSNLTKIDSSLTKIDSSLTKIDSIVNPVKPLLDKDYSMKVDFVDSKIDFSVDTTNSLIEDHTVTPHNLKSELSLNTESTESTESNLDKETQSQQGFIKVDDPENTQSTLVNRVTFSESPQDSDRPETDNLKPGGECIYKKNGRAHWVISVDGDLITIHDWYEENPPFTVAIDQVLLDTPGTERGKGKNKKPM